MTWNYRVINHAAGFGISEVYYDPDGAIYAWSRPTAPHGESRKELRRDLKLMRRAFDKPTLDVVDLPGYVAR